MENKFQMVGIRTATSEVHVQKKKRFQGKPVISGVILSVIMLGCLCCNLIMTKTPGYMDLASCNTAPNGEFLFGTDTTGRDIFSMIWYGGRISLLIGFLGASISTAIAIVFGAMSGSAPEWLDTLFMRTTEILTSIPSLLLVILLQACMGPSSVWSLAIVIGMTNWMSMAKVVRMEVRQIRNSDYVIASRCMGGSFFHILWSHLTPNFISSIMFMVVMNVRGAIIAESTLSFMGIGLPLEVVTWGSMLSLADKALLTNAWWIIWIPSVFLVVTLMCITNVGNYMRRSANRRERHL